MAARLSANINDFALIAMLGLLSLRIFQACGANIDNLGAAYMPPIRDLLIWTVETPVIL